MIANLELAAASNDLLSTSELVSGGHPDKIADQISDTILDATLAQDKYARAAAETLYNTGLVVLVGKITTMANVDYIYVVRETIKCIGHGNTEYGTDYKGCAALVVYDKQSPDIAQGVDCVSDGYLNQGAGDQGLMFGYAYDETPELMPFPIYYVHRLTEHQSQLRRDGCLSRLCPDVKSQMAVRYVDSKSHSADTVVLSTQYAPEISQEAIRGAVIEEIIKSVLPSYTLAETEYLVDLTGCFVIGGPQGDCGLAGRKTVVGTYSGVAPHGGGALSGKDPSKVNRSMVYVACYAAENVAAAGLACQCQVQVGYAIGVARPINITVYTEGMGVIPNEQIAKLVQEHFNLRPKDIVQMLDLLRPIHEKIVVYDHFSREGPEFGWEVIDKVLLLRGAAGLAGEPVKVFV